MKISESRQNTRQHKDKKRLTSSFFLTCFIYLPAFVFAWSSVPETTFKAAGQEQTVALSFAQISGGGVSTPEVAATESVPESEPDVRTEPEPKEIVNPQPKPGPAVKKAQQKKVEKKPHTLTKSQPKKQVRKTVPKTDKQTESSQVQQSFKALAPAPIQTDRGAATASALHASSTSIALGGDGNGTVCRAKRWFDGRV